MPVSKRARKSKRSVKSRKLRGGREAHVLSCPPGYTPIMGEFSSWGLDNFTSIEMGNDIPENFGGVLPPYYNLVDSFMNRSMVCYDPVRFDPEQHMRNLAEWQAVRDRQNAEMREANYESGRKFRNAANVPVSSLPTSNIPPDGMTQEELAAQQAAQNAATAQWATDPRSGYSPSANAATANAATANAATANPPANAAANTAANAAANAANAANAAADAAANAANAANAAANAANPPADAAVNAFSTNPPANAFSTNPPVNAFSTNAAANPPANAFSTNSPTNPPANPPANTFATNPPTNTFSTNPPANPPTNAFSTNAATNPPTNTFSTNAAANPPANAASSTTPVDGQGMCPFGFTEYQFPPNCQGNLIFPQDGMMLPIGTDTPEYLNAHNISVYTLHIPDNSVPGFRRVICSKYDITNDVANYGITSCPPMGGRRSKTRKTKSKRAMKKRRTVKRRGVKGRKGY